MAKQISRILSKWWVFEFNTPQLLFQTFMVILFVLIVSISSVETAIWPSPISSSSATTKQQCSISSTNTETYGVTEGSVSKNLYFLYLINPSSTAIMRMNASGTQKWLASFAFYPILKSLSVDPSEKNVYLASWTDPLSVLWLDASDGSIVFQKKL